MPQGSTTPNWYNDDTYIKDKVAECNVIRFGDAEQLPWTAESVRSFLAAANGEEDYQPWMGYDNFVSNGNAENCSPNPLFNVMEYVTAKAKQLNAMNDDAGYEGNNAWTAESVLKYFNDHHITAWDHFTTAGQFENVNPSNALDLSDFFDKKAAQCNAMEFDGRSDWNADAVKEYFQANGLNAVMVAANASDPNVVPVPADEAVTVPSGETPWGAIQLVQVDLTDKQDIVDDGGIPTNFVATVESSATKSTLNQNDQITGTNDADVLTVNMSTAFRGMNKDGFVKDVPTIDLTNTSSGDRDLTFNTAGITGAETYNIDGNIGLDRLASTGITINLNNVNSNTAQDFSFADGVATGTDDALTIGLNNVYVPGSTDQPATAVTLSARNIEDLTLNATGANKNIVNLSGIDYMRSLDVTGDGKLEVTAVSAPLTTIDASAANGNLDLNVTGTTAQITEASLGSGNDVLTVKDIDPNATINGGAGDDRLDLTPAAGTYALHMTEVETMRLNGATQSVTLDGSDVDGMDNLVLNGTGSRTQTGPAATQNQIDLAHFNNSELHVQAMNFNAANLLIADIPNVNLRVGEGNPNTQDSFEGNLTLGSAEVLTIDATDHVTTNSVFDGKIDASNVNNLNLNAARNSVVTVEAGSNLAALSQIDVSGWGNITMQQGNISTQVNTVNVDTTRMNDGSFTGVFANNEITNNGAPAATLTIDGGNLADNNITVDNTYKAVQMNAGMGDDVLTIKANGSTTAPTISGDLGGGANRVILDGVQNADLTGLAGTGSLMLVNGATVAAGKGGTWGVGTPNTAIPVDADQDNPVATVDGTEFSDTFKLDVKQGATNVTVDGEGRSDTYGGTINSMLANVTLNGQNGAVVTEFVSAAPDADATNELYVQQAQNLTVNGGSAGFNNITGTVAAGAVLQNFVLNNSANTIGGDVVDLAGVAANNDVKITGASGAQNEFNAVVTSAKNVTIDTGDAEAGSTTSVAGVTGNVNLTGGTAADTFTVNAAGVTGNITINADAGADVINLSGIAAAAAPTEGTTPTQSLTVDGGAENDTIEFTGTNDLTGWGANITNVETINNAGDLTISASQLGTAKLAQSADAASLTLNDNVTTQLDLSAVDKGTTEITMGTGAKVDLGDAADTIVLGKGVSTATDLNAVIDGFGVASDHISLDGFLDDLVWGTSGVNITEAYTGKDGSAGSAAAGNGSGGTAGNITWTFTVSVSGANTAVSADVDQTVSFDQLGSGDKIYALDSGISAGDKAAISAMFQADSISVIHTQFTSGATKVEFTVDDGTVTGLYLADGSDAMLAVNNGTGTNLWYVSNGDAAGLSDLSISLIGTVDVANPADLSAVFQ